MNIEDKIVEISYVGEHDTIDIDVDSADHLFYANGILTHNSAVEESEFDHSHISGGISKINTADNVFGIFTSRSMRERGRYQLQIMKTRSSAGVGQKVDLDFDINSLKIADAQKSDDSDTGRFSEIYNNVTQKSEPNADTGIVSVNDESGKSRIDSDVQSTKLRQMLNQIKSQ